MSLCETFCYSGADGAGTAHNDLPSGLGRTEAINALVHGLMRRYPEKATSWTESLPNDDCAIAIRAIHERAEGNNHDSTYVVKRTG